MVSTARRSEVSLCDTCCSEPEASSLACPACAAFCLTVLASCSIEAAVSSRELACTSVRRDRSSLPWAISRTPLTTTEADSLMRTISSFMLICRMRRPWARLANSAAPPVWIRPERSPELMRSMSARMRRTARATGRYSARPPTRHQAAPAAASAIAGRLPAPSTPSAANRPAPTIECAATRARSDAPAARARARRAGPAVETTPSWIRTPRRPSAMAPYARSAASTRSRDGRVRMEVNPVTCPPWKIGAAWMSTQ